MNILITGGTGFIGSALTRKLADANHSVTVLTRNGKKAREILGHSIRCIESPTELDTPLLDAVFNLAGAPIADKRWTPARKQLLEHSRIEFTHNLIRELSAINASVGAFISGSAIGYYGAQEANFVTEDTQPTEEYQHQLCLKWEKAASQAESLGARVCQVRTGLVVGRNGGFLQKLLPAFKFGLGGKLGSGEQFMSWIHLDDMVALLLFLLHHQTLQGPFNATAPHPVNNAEFTSTLASILSRPAMLTTPAPLLKIALGELSHLLLTGQRVIPEKIQQAGFEFQHPYLETAIKASL